MLATLHSHAVIGMHAHPIEVETDLGWGLPAFSIVGLPDAAVREARERVRAGMSNSGFEFPLRRITVNLAPADLRKEGPSFDLPIALSLLAASEQMKSRLLDDFSAVGELSLDGGVRRINGALAMAESARHAGKRGLLLPVANSSEAAMVAGLEVIGVHDLGEAFAFLTGTKAIAPAATDTARQRLTACAPGPDLADVRGQQHARRALEVCAAGGHNLMMVGRPGSGKTMIARRLPSILPPLEIDEAIEITRIYSVAGMLNGTSLINERPFRAPHHTISHAGLAGGGGTPRPGEVSLAHLGVLFLDELPEFPRRVLETLRQPLEDGAVTISRALHSVTYPARFMLVGAMNPCPCGYFGDERQPCVCPPNKVAAYRARLSGPLLDRIDVAVEVPGLSRKEMEETATQESSSEVAVRVRAARKRQNRRLAGSQMYCNAQMDGAAARRFCGLSQSAADLLGSAIDRLGLSARAYQRILKVARTIADLDCSRRIEPAHVAEAISYRMVDRQGWDGR